MSALSFADIESLVRQESARQHHYFLGVEHLFIALAQLEEGILSQALDRLHCPAALAIHALRESAGQVLDRRYWEGYRITPRYAKVLEIAQIHAGDSPPGEYELLLAILEEGDSVPIRVLRDLNIPLVTLKEMFQKKSYVTAPRDPILETSQPLTVSDMKLIKQLFAGTVKVVVSDELDFILPSARIYGVEVSSGGQKRHYLVKFDRAAAIIEEKWRYHHFVKPLEFQQDISYPELVVVDSGFELGALGYAIPAPIESFRTIFGRDTASHREMLIAILDQWRQWAGERVMRRFELWRECEFLLPPALVISIVDRGYEVQSLSPLGAWSRDRAIKVGDYVDLHDFVILSINPGRETLIMGSGAGYEAAAWTSRIEVMGIGKSSLTDHFVGQSIRSLIGRVMYVREELLLDRLQRLSPEFNLISETWELPIGHFPSLLGRLPSLLEREISAPWGLVTGNLTISGFAAEPGFSLLSVESMRFGCLFYDLAALELFVWLSLWGKVGKWALLYPLLGTLDLATLQLHAPPDQAPFLVEQVELLTLIREQVQGHLKSYWGFLGFLALAEACYGLDVGRSRLALLLALLAFKQIGK